MIADPTIHIGLDVGRLRRQVLEGCDGQLHAISDSELGANVAKTSIDNALGDEQ